MSEEMDAKEKYALLPDEGRRMVSWMLSGNRISAKDAIDIVFILFRCGKKQQCSQNQQKQN